MTRDFDDDNFSLLPRDSSGPKKQSALDRFDFGVKEEPEEGRFSVLQNSGSSNNYAPVEIGSGANKRKLPATATGKTTSQLGKNANAGQMDSSTKELDVAGEDYQKAYLRKQRESAAHAQNKSESDRKQQEKAAADRTARQNEDALRARARDLRQQIQRWQGEISMNNYDEMHINGQIATLEQQLNAIDPRYWG